MTCLPILLQKMLVEPCTGSSSGVPEGPPGCGTTAAKKMTTGWWPTRGGPTPSHQVLPWFRCHCQEVAPLAPVPTDTRGLLQHPTRPTSLCPGLQPPNSGRALGGWQHPLAPCLPPLTAPSCSHLPEDNPGGRAQGASGGWEQLLGHAVHRGPSGGCATGTLPLLRGPARDPTRHTGGEEPRPPSPQEQIRLQEVLREEGVRPSWGGGWGGVEKPQPALHPSLRCHPDLVSTPSTSSTTRHPPQGREAAASGSTPAGPRAALRPSHCRPRPQPSAEHPSCLPAHPPGAPPGCHWLPRRLADTQHKQGWGGVGWGGGVVVFIKKQTGA